MAETVGALLRESREARGLTLEDAERATRIRIRYLAAIEADEWEAMPSPTQVRGFLRNYSEYLGLDADQVLDLFDAPARRMSFTEFARALIRPRTPGGPRQAPPPEPPPAQSAPTVIPPLMPPLTARRKPSWFIRVRSMRWLSADIVVGAVVIIALLAFFIWGSSRLAGVLFTVTQEATPIELGRPDATLTPSLEPTVGQGTTPPPTLAATTAQSAALLDVPVTLEIEQTAWLRVIVDGAEAYRGLAAPGTTQQYVGTTSVEVLTANGAGVRVIYGSGDLGVMGRFGEVVSRIYTLAGVMVPTAAAPPEPTETLAPGTTALPSATLRISPTPTLRPTLAPSATPRPSETVPPPPTGTSTSEA